jgi:hypothetical protein
VGDQATFEKLLSGAVFLIPLAVFLTLVVLLVRRARHPGRGRSTSMPQDDGGPLQVLSRPDARRAEPEASASPASAAASTVDETLSVDQIGKRIDAAVAAGDRMALAGLYLALARGHRREGNAAASMSALRSAAGYGALHGPRVVHAAARLELAEVAYEAGDLTSACEQWQLARTAFLDDGATAEHAAVEKRMRDNGCPTDWVLTDF